MSKTLKLDAKTPKKKLLKKIMIKTRKSDFFLLKTFFLSFYSYFCPYIFVNTALFIHLFLSKKYF